MASYEMPSEVAEYAGQVFIQARQDEQQRDGKVKTDDYVFHKYLTLARYMNIGKFGSLQLTQACFDEARQLEEKRVQRVEARQPPAKEPALEGMR